MEFLKSFGGVSAEAERVLKCLDKAVAANTDTPEEVVALQFWQRVGVDILRGNCRAFHRWLLGKRFGTVEGGNPYRGVLGLQFAGGLQLSDGLCLLHTTCHT